MVLCLFNIKIKIIANSIYKLVLGMFINFAYSFSIIPKGIYELFGELIVYIRDKINVIFFEHKEESNLFKHFTILITNFISKNAFCPSNRITSKQEIYSPIFFEFESR